MKNSFKVGVFSLFLDWLNFSLLSFMSVYVFSLFSVAFVANVKLVNFAKN